MHNITRQGFLRAGGAFAFAPFAGTLFAADEKPLFRMGVMTDTHVGTTLESCSRVKAALELFKSKGVDMVVNNGDIADHFYPSGYRALRQIYNSTFPDAAARPREVWVYTCPGAPGVLRYVFEFSHPEKASGSCKLSFRRGVGSRVRFVRVRLDRTV